MSTTSIIWPWVSARIETVDGATTTYGYDSRQRLATLRTVGAQNVIYQDWHYQLDGVSNILRIDDLHSTTTAAEDGSQSHTYDSLYRLTSTKYIDGNQIDFGYDPLGNLVRQTATLPALNLGELQVGQNAGPHAVTQVNGAPWRYDRNGNLIEKPDFTFTWDFRNRLTQVASQAGLQQEHRYNYADERMVKWVKNGAETELTLYPDRSFEVRGNQAVKYLFANDERIAEVRTPFDKSHLLHGFQGEGASAAAAPAPTTTLFYHGDHLGSATVVVDPSGNVVERRTYYPFGQTRAQLGASTAPYGFTGKELDVESGLFYYGARYYDPVVARFISVDPLYFEQPEKGLADPQMLNLYAYVRNNPVHNVDPDGEDVVIAYGVGDDQTGNRAAADRLATELSRENIRVRVIVATDLLKTEVQDRLAQAKVSAAIFVGHGYKDTYWLSAYDKPVGKQQDNPVSLEDFAQKTHVLPGGVVGGLACGTVTGYTKSEQALAARGVNTIGFRGKVSIDSLNGSIQPQEHRPVDMSTATLSREDVGPGIPWSSPGATQPTVQAGPNPIPNGTFGSYVKEAEERTKPKK